MNKFFDTSSKYLSLIADILDLATAKRPRHDQRGGFPFAASLVGIVLIAVLVSTLFDGIVAYQLLLLLSGGTLMATLYYLLCRRPGDNPDWTTTAIALQQIRRLWFWLRMPLVVITVFLVLLVFHLYWIRQRDQALKAITYPGPMYAGYEDGKYHFPLGLRLLRERPMTLITVELEKSNRTALENHFLPELMKLRSLFPEADVLPAERDN